MSVIMNPDDLTLALASLDDDDDEPVVELLELSGDGVALTGRVRSRGISTCAAADGGDPGDVTERLCSILSSGDECIPVFSNSIVILVGRTSIAR